jgi:hypothetical protein
MEAFLAVRRVVGAHNIRTRMETAEGLPRSDCAAQSRSVPNHGVDGVDSTRWTCTCPAFDRWPPCKHVNAVDALVKTEGR